MGAGRPTDHPPLSRSRTTLGSKSCNMMCSWTPERAAVTGSTWRLPDWRAGESADPETAAATLDEQFLGVSTVTAGAPGRTGSGGHRSAGQSEPPRRSSRDRWPARRRQGPPAAASDPHRPWIGLPSSPGKVRSRDCPINRPCAPSMRAPRLYSRRRSQVSSRCWRSRRSCHRGLHHPRCTPSPTPATAIRGACLQSGRRVRHLTRPEPR